MAAPGSPEQRASENPPLTSQRLGIRSILFRCFSGGNEQGLAEEARQVTSGLAVPSSEDAVSPATSDPAGEEAGIMVTCDVEAGIAPRQEAGEELEQAGDDPTGPAAVAPTQQDKAWSFMDDEIAFLLSDCDGPNAITFAPSARASAPVAQSPPQWAQLKEDLESSTSVTSISCPVKYSSEIPQEQLFALALAAALVPPRSPTSSTYARSRPVSRASTLPTIDEVTTQRRASSSGSLAQDHGPEGAPDFNFRQGLMLQAEELMPPAPTPCPLWKDTRSDTGTASTSLDLGRFSYRESVGGSTAPHTNSTPGSSTNASHELFRPQLAVALNPHHGHNLALGWAHHTGNHHPLWQPPALGLTTSDPDGHVIRNTMPAAVNSSFSSSRSSVSRSASRGNNATNSTVVETPSMKIIGADASMATRWRMAGVSRQQTAPQLTTARRTSGAGPSAESSVLARVRARLMQSQQEQQQLAFSLMARGGMQPEQTTRGLSTPTPQWALKGEDAVDDLVAQFGAHDTGGMSEVRHTWPGVQLARLNDEWAAKASLSSASQRGRESDASGRRQSLGKR